MPEREAHEKAPFKIFYEHVFLRNASVLRAVRDVTRRVVPRTVIGFRVLVTG
jgi:hypothetical protein